MKLFFLLSRSPHEERRHLLNRRAKNSLNSSNYADASPLSSTPVRGKNKGDGPLFRSGRGTKRYPLSFSGRCAGWRGRPPLPPRKKVREQSRKFTDIRFPSITPGAGSPPPLDLPVKPLFAFGHRSSPFFLFLRTREPQTPPTPLVCVMLFCRDEGIFFPLLSVKEGWNGLVLPLVGKPQKHSPPSPPHLLRKCGSLLSMLFRLSDF